MMDTQVIEGTETAHRRYVEPNGTLTPPRHSTIWDVKFDYFRCYSYEP